MVTLCNISRKETPGKRGTFQIIFINNNMDSALSRSYNDHCNVLANVVAVSVEAAFMLSKPVRKLSFLSFKEVKNASNSR